MTDDQGHAIQTLSMATNASYFVGATNKGLVYVFAPAHDTKVISLFGVTMRCHCIVVATPIQHSIVVCAETSRRLVRRTTVLLTQKKTCGCMP